MQTMTQESVDKVRDNLKQLVRDSEELLKDDGGELSEKGREARAKLQATLEAAKATCHRLEEKALAAAKAADQVIRDHPYQSIGVALGLGMLIGVPAARR
jgi:ElaB/YqjD/DUF883 family membrane-anchored ribosome-binding protein